MTLKPASKLFPILAAAIAAQAAPLHAQDAADPYKNNPAAAAASSAPVRYKPLSVREETFSMDIRDAFTLLGATTSDEQKYDQVVKLVNEGKAVIEKLMLVRSMSGQRSLIESNREYRYPTEFGPMGEEPKSVKRALRQRLPRPGEPNNPPDAGSPAVPASNGLVGPQSFETRNLGDTLEIEMVAGPDGRTIDATLVPQHVEHLRDLDIPASIPIQQPLIATQKTTTSILAVSGKPRLLSAMNQPAEGPDGRSVDPSQRRVWLSFITCDVLDESGKPSANATRTGWNLAQTLVLPSLEFANVSVREALALVHRKSAELDPAKTGVAIELSQDAVPEHPEITMKLRDVTVANAIVYIAHAAGLDVTSYGGVVTVSGGRKSR